MLNTAPSLALADENLNGLLRSASKAELKGHICFGGWAQGCEAMAAHVSRLIEVPERSNMPTGSLPSQKAQCAAPLTRAEAVAELQRLPGAVRGALSEVVARGAAFHHAGALPRLRMCL